MISVEEALERVLNCVHVLEAEEKPILEALGQVLAEDVHSPVDVPPLDNAAMDGYAVRAEDTLGATPTSPRVLKVVAEAAAGTVVEHRLEPGEAIRIMTGAPLPPGATAVIPFEDTDEMKRQSPIAEIGIHRSADGGLNIRRAGEDITKGSLVLRKGTVLRPQEIGVLASLGRGRVQVVRRPRVAILATGDELIDVGQPPAPGKIYDSNTYTIACQVRRAGGIPRILGIAPDREERLVAKVREGLEADMLLTSGGVSLGDYDMVKGVLAKEGEIAFWTVRMKPGKPLAFGSFAVGEGDRLRRVPHLGFPGNPVSSMISFELFARPAILKMMGKTTLSKPTVTAILEDRVINSDRRRIFARVNVERRQGQYFARLTGPQGSGILTSMAWANGLAIIPEDVAEAKPGDTVQVIMLDWAEGQGA
ncbi:MAG TPA: molybdopterin molybdotransferase MoeA [Dehalococcoidia bacterium]|nr:molybdopterin molybdotransferase MoeA [Dehalococcoidia bacterium]